MLLVPRGWAAGGTRSGWTAPAPSALRLRRVEPDLVALRVGHGGIPAEADVRRRRDDRTAVRDDRRDRCVHVVDRDVVPDLARCRLAAQADAATEVARAGFVERVVVEALGVAELPAEHVRVEGLRPLEVVGRELDMAELTLLRHPSASSLG